MKYLEVDPREIDNNDYVNRQPEESDCSRHVDYDAVIHSSSGDVLCVYQVGISSPAMNEAKRIFHKDPGGFVDATRSGGLRTQSRIFGYAPRNALRNSPCRAASTAEDMPDFYAAMERLGLEACEWYSRMSPEAYEKHKKIVDDSEMVDDYKIRGSVFTSGIANKNNALHYHLDRGNFKSCRQVMAGFRHKSTGGLLCVPELDISFSISDRSFISFDGQRLVHGVTPIKVRKGGYRFTAVYYSMQQMWKCLPLKEEIQHYRSSRTDAEKRSPWAT